MLYQMPSKKKPPPLHVSRALIASEQANVVLRTQRRIALLRLQDNSNDYDAVPAKSHYNSCLSMFCFCLSLVVMNLLFLQWLYYQVRNAKQL